MKVVSATAGEAPHVLDGLLYHQSDLRLREHHTDTGGVSDHMFALCHLLGFRFAPRIRGPKDRRLYAFESAAMYPSLLPLIDGRINERLIREQWPEILWLATSIRNDSVTASLVLRRLGAYPQRDNLAQALREIGRLGRTLFTLDWLQDPFLRRRTSQELNKGEGRLLPSSRKVPGPQLRQPALPGQRSQSRDGSNHPVEHDVPEPGRRRHRARGVGLSQVA